MSKVRSNRRLRTFVKRFVNPVLRNFARSSRGPFALLRHVGRRSGKQYENPIWVWRMKDGFMIVLTYGRNTDWLRNLQAADQGSLRWHRREYTFKRPEIIDAKTAEPALPSFIRFVLRLRGQHEYVKLADAR
ncbi:MAG TPA: nitroreductase family deazaflavin-dependent oxidoreductase [Ktedonobacterales bacterium]|nr:nitroreductase family deazaflavin-dependent oxidoreductase [Ktedonobacterales bacterium]